MVFASFFGRARDFGPPKSHPKGHHLDSFGGLDEAEAPPPQSDQSACPDNIIQHLSSESKTSVVRLHKCFLLYIFVGWK